MAVDSDYVQRMLTHYERVWSQAISNWEENARFYTQEELIWDRSVEPGSRPTRRPGLWTAVIDHAVANQLSDEPRFTRHPVKKGEIHKERANRIERWLGVVFEILVKNAVENPIKACNRNFCTYGYTSVDAPRLRMLPKEQPKRKRGEKKEDFEKRLERYERELVTYMPFTMETPPPGQLLLDPTKKYPTEGLGRFKMYAYELADLTLRKAQVGRGVEWTLEGDPYEQIEVVEFFSLDEHKLLKGSEARVQEPNPWGFIPFKHAFSGWGGKRVSEDGANPRWLAKSLYDPIKDSLRGTAQQYVAKLAGIIEGGFPRTGSGKDALEAKAELETPGALLTGVPGTYWRLAPIEMASWLNRLGEELKGDIEIASYAFTLAGFRIPGVSTVGQQAILTNAAQRIFAAPKGQLEGLMGLVAGDILRLVDILNETYGIEELIIGGERITSADIDGDYNVEVSFELLDPMMHMQEKQLAILEYQAGLISWEDYQMIARREDTTGIRKRLLQDKVYAHPAVADQMGKQEAKEMGALEMIEAWEREQEEAALAAGGRAGTETSQQAALGRLSQELQARTAEMPPEEGGVEVPPLRQAIGPQTAKPPIMTR